MLIIETLINQYKKLIDIKFENNNIKLFKNFKNYFNKFRKEEINYRFFIFLFSLSSVVNSNFERQFHLFQ